MAGGFFFLSIKSDVINSPVCFDLVGDPMQTKVSAGERAEEHVGGRCRFRLFCSCAVSCT